MGNGKIITGTLTFQDDSTLSLVGVEIEATASNFGVLFAGSSTDNVLIISNSVTIKIEEMAIKSLGALSLSLNTSSELILDVQADLSNTTYTATYGIYAEESDISV